MIQEKAKKGYSEILKVLRKYEDVCTLSINDAERHIENHLFGLKLKEEYGFNINPENVRSRYWNTLGNFIGLGFYGEKHRTVSNCKQEEDEELLLNISFPTGPYIFGNDYPIELFGEFFAELKTYGPKYSDPLNASLYFSMDNAGKVFNDFNEIYEKYRTINKNDIKQRKIQKLEKELQELKQ